MKSLIERARSATTELRDAARDGHVIDYRRRDALVMAIHDVIDLCEELLVKREEARK